MESVSQDQIMDKVVHLLLHAKTIKKGMNPYFLPTTLSRL